MRVMSSKFGLVLFVPFGRDRYRDLRNAFGPSCLPGELTTCVGRPLRSAGSMQSPK